MSVGWLKKCQWVWKETETNTTASKGEKSIYLSKSDEKLHIYTINATTLNIRIKLIFFLNQLKT